MITIHCGLHKTGTSSIQLALRNSRRLKRVIVPKPGNDQSDRAWRERLKQARNSRLLSDENLLGAPFDCYASAQSRISLMREALSDCEYRLVVYLRPQPDWLESVYLQGIQQGCLQSPKEFWSEMRKAPYLRWSTLLDVLERESGATGLIVRPYGDGADSVADFFETCSLPRQSRRLRQFPLRENVSISPLQSAVMRKVAADTDLTIADRQRLRWVFQEELAGDARRDFSVFSAQVTQEIRDQTFPDWQKVTERVIAQDPLLGERFAQLESCWETPLLPAPTETEIDAETVRSLRILALSMNYGPQRPKLYRFRQKLGLLG